MLRKRPASHQMQHASVPRQPVAQGLSKCDDVSSTVKVRPKPKAKHTARDRLRKQAAAAAAAAILAASVDVLRTEGDKSEVFCVNNSDRKLLHVPLPANDAEPPVVLWVSAEDDDTVQDKTRPFTPSRAWKKGALDWGVISDVAPGTPRTQPVSSTFDESYNSVHTFEPQIPGVNIGAQPGSSPSTSSSSQPPEGPVPSISGLFAIPPFLSVPVYSFPSPLLGYAVCPSSHYLANCSCFACNSSVSITELS